MRRSLAGTLLSSTLWFMNTLETRLPLTLGPSDITGNWQHSPCSNCLFLLQKLSCVSSRTKAAVDLPYGRLRARLLRRKRPPTSSHHASSKSHSSSLFSADPDLNVPMDIFDEEDEDHDHSNTHDENPSEAVGASAKTSFEVKQNFGLEFPQNV